MDLWAFIMPGFSVELKMYHFYRENNVNRPRQLVYRGLKACLSVEVN